jgi:hypothetical protein
MMNCTPAARSRAASCSHSGIGSTTPTWRTESQYAHSDSGATHAQRAWRPCPNVICPPPRMAV